MAVIAVWQCDRDNSMFTNKKDADEHDKMLELAANITTLIEANITGIDEAQSEAIGILLAKHRDNLAKACKGKPETLFDGMNAEVVSDVDSSGTVTPISANSGN